MNGITRFRPLGSEIARFDPFFDMDNMFDRLNRSMMFPLFREGVDMEPQIRMDVKEADGKYLIHADIPGVNKDDIHVMVDGNRVSITAEIKQEKEAKEGERVIRCERGYGMASRTFTLADEVDQENIQAKYNNGVLELILPKKTGLTKKEIPIS